MGYVNKAGRKWVARSIAFDLDQFEVVNYICERYNLSVAELVDYVLSSYWPHKFGKPWPVPERRKRSRHLTKNKLRRPGVHVDVFGILWTPEQDKIFVEAINQLFPENPHGAISALIEEAMRSEMPRIFHVRWPHHRRIRVVPGGIEERKENEA